MALIFFFFFYNRWAKCRRSLESPPCVAVVQQRMREHLSSLFLFFLPPPSNTTTICPFLPFHVLKQYPHPSHSNSTAPPPPAPCSGFFFPWIFASHHADGPLALPDGSVFPPPPPAVLLFHSKMASALEPLVCGCIFRLVVVSVSHGFGTFSSAARHEIPVSSSGSRMGEYGIFLHGLLYPSFPRKPEPDQLGLSGEPREVEGERGTEG